MVNKVKVMYLMAGDPKIFGGGKRVFLQNMRFLNKNKYQFLSCCAFNKDQEDYLLRLGGEIIHIDIQHGGLLLPIYKLTKLIIKEKIDIIHSQGARADFYGRVSARLSGLEVKIVNTMATLVEGYDVGILRKKIYSAMDSFTEKYVHKFIAVSKAIETKLIETHSIDEQKVITIYNGIEFQEYQSNNRNGFLKTIRKEFNISDEVIMIGCIGRLVRGKGVEYLIACIPSVIKKFPQTKVLIVGEGRLKKSLERLADQLEVRNYVIFAGFRKDVKEILSTIDILVLPSLSEGFPMITLEAMCMAKPIIATEIDGIAEQIIDGKDGILVPPKDPNALSNAIVRLIQDKELSKKLGMSARERIEKEFSVEKMVKETEKVYLSLLGAN